jgi:hypothetical protein
MCPPGFVKSNALNPPFAVIAPVSMEQHQWLVLVLVQDFLHEIRMLIPSAMPPVPTNDSAASAKPYSLLQLLKK